MHLTNKDIFWKCWLWSLIGGVVIATLFWIISGIGSLFHGPNGGTIFIDLLLSFSLLGSYVGAAFVGWRIVDKYHHSDVKVFLKRYGLYGIISFAVLMVVIYSPLSFLAVLWSAIAPLCVIIALNNVRKQA